MATTQETQAIRTTSRQSKAQYPSKDWFADQLCELRAQEDAMLRLARAHGIDPKTITCARSNRLTMKEASFRVLEAAGEPVHLNEILEKVAEMGAPAGGKRPGNTLHASLSRDDRVKLVGQNTWALVEWGQTTAAPKN